MGASFFQQLEERVRASDSLLCVGLDPHPQDLPEPSAAAAFDQCRHLIESTAKAAAAYKANLAFFLAFGSSGWDTLQKLRRFVPPDIPFILDAKFGDVPSTMQAYAQATFRELSADAVTLSPYLGQDSLRPFLEDPSRGAFLLCRTTNEGAGDLQDLRLAFSNQIEMLYEQVASLTQLWDHSGNLGLVVAGNDPAALARVRSLAPDSWFLAPGIGTQGGQIESALRAGLRRDGMGILVAVSRSLSRSSDPAQTAIQMIVQIRKVREEMRGALGTPLTGAESHGAGEPPVATRSLRPQLVSLADALLECGCVRFGSFRLKSGSISPVYIDLRLLASYPRVLDQVAVAYGQMLQGLRFDRIAAIPYAALPIGTAVSMRYDVPLIYPRREAKSYGTGALIEGVFHEGEIVLLLDDVATTGESKLEALQTLQSAGLAVKDIVVLIDRQMGAAEWLGRQGYRLHSVLTLAGLIDDYESRGKIAPQQAREVRAFLASSAKPGSNGGDHT